MVKFYNFLPLIFSLFTLISYRNNNILPKFYQKKKQNLASAKNVLVSYFIKNIIFLFSSSIY